MTEKEFKDIVQNQDPVVYCLSHIARQLTIANEIEQEKNDKTFCIAYGKGLEMGKHQKSADSANIRLEILEKAFLHDTGIVAPHKIQRADAVSSSHSSDSIEYREAQWQKWLKENDVPEPTPQTGLATDALVEAVRNHIRANDVKHFGRLTPAEMKPLEDALTDHEKAAQ